MNLVFFAAAIGGMAVLARQAPGARPTFILYALGVASTSPAIDFAAELRSNYVGLVGAFLTFAALAVHATPRIGDDATKRPPLILVFSLLLALNTHFVMTLLVGAVTGAFFLRLCFARCRAAAWRLAIATAIAAAPAVACLAAQILAIERATRSFWIEGGTRAALHTIRIVIEPALSANAFLTVAGLAGLLLLAVRSWRSRRLNDGLDLVLTLATGCGAGLALLMVIHMWRPIFVLRYLTPLLPAIMLALAAGATAVLARVGRRAGLILVALIVLAALWSIRVHLQWTIARKTWYEGAALIAREIDRCPGSLVHGNPSWTPQLFEGEPYSFLRSGLTKVAAVYRFRLEPLESRRMAPRCPTIFWAEEWSENRPSETQAAARLRRGGFLPRHIELHTTKSGWLLISRP